MSINEILKTLLKNKEYDSIIFDRNKKISEENFLNYLNKNNTDYYKDDENEDYNIIGLGSPPKYLIYGSTREEDNNEREKLKFIDIEYKTILFDKSNINNIDSFLKNFYNVYKRLRFDIIGCGIKRTFTKMDDIIMICKIAIYNNNIVTIRKEYAGGEIKINIYNNYKIHDNKYIIINNYICRYFRFAE